MGSRKIFDAHCHIFPEIIAEKAVVNIGKFYDLPMAGSGTAERLIQAGEVIGVTRYLVCSVATVPQQVGAINDFVHGQCGRHSEFIGFATLHPLMEGIFEEIDRAVGMGLRGIKLHPDFQTFNADAEEMMPVYEYLAAKKLPVLLHAGDPRYDFSSPSRIAHVAERNPQLTVIAAHFGGYQKWKEAVKTLKLPNVYFDTSSSLRFLEKEETKSMLSHFGVDKFMFGTDFPMWKHEEELERFLALGLSERENERIFYQTFEELLG